MRILRLFSAVTIGPALLLAIEAGAAEYPTQTVRLISAFSAGGGNDLMARELAQRFTERWKKTFIVENKPGASGDLATDYVAHAPPDGHTLLVTTNATIVINPQLFKDVIKFDPVKDFAPASLLARQPFLLVVNPKLPIRTLAELIDHARANPDKLNFGSSGAGGGAHLAGEMLKVQLGLKMTHVPYRGVAPALQDLVAGTLDFMFAAILTARPFVDNGQLRALAVTSLTRNSSMPDVASVAEYPGLQGFESDLWYGLLAPAKTDPTIVTGLSHATAAAFKDPGLRARFESSGTVLVGSTPEEFADVIKHDLKKWNVVLRSAGMLAQK